MFGGKKEKALEAELSAIKAENVRRGELLADIVRQKDDILEQFARMTASNAQMENDVAQVKEHLQQIFELAENSAVAASEVHGAMIEINNGIGTFDVNHSVFVSQMKKQNEKIVDIVEKNKHFTTPMKHISEAPTSLKEERQELRERTVRMKELSKNMSVLALNAAIEAGRLGEAGSRFVVAAEDVRSFSEKYEAEAVELEEKLAASEQRITELEEQIHHLNELLKENNISMGKLYKDALQNMATYEACQIDIRSLVSDVAIARADALQQSERENEKTEERMLLNIGDIEDEIKEQKATADELEALCKKLQQTAEKGRRNG